MFFLSRSHEDRFLLFREAIKLHSSILGLWLHVDTKKLTADTRQFKQVNEWQKKTKAVRGEIKSKRRKNMVRRQNKNYKKEKMNNNQIEGMSTIESIITIGLGILLLFLGGGRYPIINWTSLYLLVLGVISVIKNLGER